MEGYSSSSVLSDEPANREGSFKAGEKVSAAIYSKFLPENIDMKNTSQIEESHSRSILCLYLSLKKSPHYIDIIAKNSTLYPALSVDRLLSFYFHSLHYIIQELKCNNFHQSKCSIFPLN